MLWSSAAPRGARPSHLPHPGVVSLTLVPWTLFRALSIASSPTEREREGETEGGREGGREEE